MSDAQRTRTRPLGRLSRDIGLRIRQNLPSIKLGERSKQALKELSSDFFLDHGASTPSVASWLGNTMPPTEILHDDPADKFHLLKADCDRMIHNSWECSDVSLKQEDWQAICSFTEAILKEMNTLSVDWLQDRYGRPLMPTSYSESLRRMGEKDKIWYEAQNALTILDRSIVQSKVTRGSSRPTQIRVYGHQLYPYSSEMDHLALQFLSAARIDTNLLVPGWILADWAKKLPEKPEENQTRSS